MNRTKCIITAFMLMLMLSACGDRSKQEPIIIEETSVAEQSLPDTTTVPDEPKTQKRGEVKVQQEDVKGKRTDVRGSTNSSGYDNMRGFDPAGEDDMDDNGMSRYMENYDDEGWD